MRGHRVQPPRDEFLAGAILAEDKHVGVGRRRALNNREDFLHRRRLRDDVRANCA
jgi:hypothetical protein